MIDIHTHILPSIDDGATDMDEAIEMARQAVASGIHTVIATPHHHARGYYSNYESIKYGTEALNSKLENHSIPLTVKAGQEVRVYDELLDDLDKGQLAMLANTQYILIEFPSSKVPRQVEELFHELQHVGLTPIIAHPERNSELANNINRLEQLIEAGALAQLTSSSIAGGLGKKLQKQSIEMCKRGLVHFVASDAHGASSRPFDLMEGYQAIDKLLGQSFVEHYQINAERLVQNLDISRQVPTAKRRFLFW